MMIDKVYLQKKDTKYQGGEYQEVKLYMIVVYAVYIILRLNHSIPYVINGHCKKFR